MKLLIITVLHKDGKNHKRSLEFVFFLLSKFWTSILNSIYSDYRGGGGGVRVKEKNKHLYKIHLFTCWKKKVLHRRPLVSPQLSKRLLHVDHRMITFYLQLNFNQCSHYITICTHVGKSTWPLGGRLALRCPGPPMIDTVLLSWLHQVVTVFKLE